MNKRKVKERRLGSERRKHTTTPKFPFYDCSGILVAQDRRILPDRRLTGISVEWLTDQELILEWPEQKEDRIRSTTATKRNTRPLQLETVLLR